MREQVVRDIKEEFLGTSFKYLVEHGLENTSVRELCKAIGVSSGSLYYWFDSKEDIYINAAKYGLEKVVSELFKFAFETINDLQYFFDNALGVMEKHTPELRLIYQVATSPVYGERMRRQAETLNAGYERYIGKLSGILGGSPEAVAPYVFMFISILLDFVVWEDKAVSGMQLQKLYQIMSAEFDNN